MEVYKYDTYTFFEEIIYDVQKGRTMKNENVQIIFYRLTMK